MDNPNDQPTHKMDAPALVRRLRGSVVAAHTDKSPFLEDVEDACELIERLQRWKDEGMRVLGEWEEVWVAAGSPGRLGQSKAEAVREFLKSGGGCDVVPGSSFSREDAVTILKMEAVCASEGIGPCPKNLLTQIAEQHPDLKAEWGWISWPNADTVS